MAPDGSEGERARPPDAPAIERFLADPTRDLQEWRWLWDGDRKFPIRSHRGLVGRFVVAAKKLLRPFVLAPQADLWERQRIYNLILLEYLQRGEDVRRVVLDVHQRRIDHLEGVWREGLAEVMGHNDALFARVDQKLDYVRRESRETWAQLGNAIAAVTGRGVEAVARAHDEQGYLELERRYRGTEVDIAGRLTPYLSYLDGGGEVLDLGCGRGEALAVLKDRGVVARGVDISGEMIEACRRKGLRAEVMDLFDALRAEPEGSLAAILSFHVIEHLDPGAVERLVRLSARALRPGGVLVLETPNPLSLVVAARNFWIDPTHRRPVHPDTLRFLFEMAGFESIEKIDLRPFPQAQRLPELPLEGLDEPTRALAHRLNELRDRLDDLIWGDQDYGLVGTRGT